MTSVLRLRLVSQVLALALLGCQTAVMTGPTCSVNGDCAPPLVCFLGRCQVECVSQLDCIRGTHCVLENGAGSCLLDAPIDHTSSPCGPGRTCGDAAEICRDFTCWNGCTTGADCLPGSYCRNGVCVNPHSSGFGYGFRVDCTTTGQCAAGEICATDHGSRRTCRRPCTASTQCTDIAATALCAAIDDPAFPSTMACVIGCNPVRQLGCLQTDRCEVNIAAAPMGTATFLECRAPDGTIVPGGQCGTTTPMLGTCGRDLGCAPVTGDMTSHYECRHFCVVDGDCPSTTPHCTGPTVMGIENADVVPGALHMCQGV